MGGDSGQDSGHLSPGLTWADYLDRLVDERGSLASLALDLSQLAGTPEDSASIERALRRLRQRGTKSGGFGVVAFPGIVPTSLPYDQEVLTNYEAGFKTEPAPGMTLNGSVFHYDYKNYQAFSIVGLSQSITNRPARINGAELELGARPVRGLTLQAFVTYLDTKVRGIILPFGRVADRVLPQAPKWSIGGRIQYAIPVGPGDITVQTDWKYDSFQYFSTFNAPIDREPGRVIGNARIAFKTNDEHWEVAAFANNITNKQYRVYNLDLSTALGISQQTFARPRWIGGSVTYTY